MQLDGAPELTVWDGDTDGERGLCAIAYEELVPCPELSFRTEGTTATYVTLIRMGDAGIDYDIADGPGGALTLTTPDRSYEIEIAYPDEQNDFIALSIDTSDRERTERSLFERVRTFIEDLL